MNTTAKREAFRDLIQRVSGVITLWARDARPMVAQTAPPAGGRFNPGIATDITAGLAAQAIITIRIGQVHPRGYDEIRRTYDADTDTLKSTICGVRVIGISFICEVLGTRESPAEYLENMRSRFSRPSVLAELRAQGLSVERVQGGFEMQIANSDNAGKRAAFDMRFNWGFVEDDTTDTGDYISSLAITGAMVRPDLSTLASRVTAGEILIDRQYTAVPFGDPQIRDLVYAVPPGRDLFITAIRVSVITPLIGGSLGANVFMAIGDEAFGPQVLLKTHEFTAASGIADVPIGVDPEDLGEFFTGDPLTATVHGYDVDNHVRVNLHTNAPLTQALVVQVLIFGHLVE